jgi:hypothetical protein
MRSWIAAAIATAAATAIARRPTVLDPRNDHARAMLDVLR